MRHTLMGFVLLVTLPTIVRADIMPPMMRACADQKAGDACATEAEGPAHCRETTCMGKYGDPDYACLVCVRDDETPPPPSDQLKNAPSDGATRTFSPTVKKPESSTAEAAPKPATQPPKDDDCSAAPGSWPLIGALLLWWSSRRR